MSRKVILGNLREVLRVRSDAELLDILQLELGRVSDLAQSIEEVPDSDLIRAWNQAVASGASW